jgi:outer membrane protein OmpA-like peptidoglycan-associated protein
VKTHRIRKWAGLMLLFPGSLLCSPRIPVGAATKFLGNWQDDQKHVTKIEVGPDGRTPVLTDDKWASAWPGTIDAQDGSLRFTEPLKRALEDFNRLDWEFKTAAWGHGFPPGFPLADLQRLGRACTPDPSGPCRVHYEFHLQSAGGTVSLQRIVYSQYVHVDSDSRGKYVPDSLRLREPQKNTATLTRVPITIGDSLLFAFDSYKLKPGADAVLSRIKKSDIDQHPGSGLLIEGHTDERGSDSYNLALSINRAKAVEEWMTRHGVDASRIEINGWGKSRPTYPNGTAANRARNRRVEITLKDRVSGVTQ